MLTGLPTLRHGAGWPLGSGPTYERSALEIYPESADLHAFLGIALLQSGDAEGAAGKFDEALALDPENVNAGRGKRMLERTQKQGDG